MNSELNGQWEGVIYYGPEYDGLNLEDLYFLADINVANQIITGTARDLDNKLDTGIATINGFIKDDFVSFIKQYEFYNYVDETGQCFIDKTKKSPEIAYKGKLFLELKTIEGDWEISEEIIIEGHKYENVCTGTFKMKRK